MNLMKLVSLMMSVLMKQVILERCYCPQLNLKDKVRIIYLVNDPAWLEPSENEWKSTLNDF